MSARSSQHRCLRGRNIIFGAEATVQSGRAYSCASDAPTCRLIVGRRTTVVLWRWLLKAGKVLDHSRNQMADQATAMVVRGTR